MENSTLLLELKKGNLLYLQNDGTPEEPMFLQNISSTEPAGNNIITLGGVDTRLGGLSGYSAPWFYDFGGEYGMFTGSDKGFLLKYSNIDGNLDGSFTLDNDNFGNHRPGFLTVPALVDINNDGVLEMFVGNSRGGLTAYVTNVMTNGMPVSNDEIVTNRTIKLYPNPTTNLVNLELEGEDLTDIRFRIFNTVGQLVHQGSSTDALTTMSTANWGTGLFVIQIEIDGEVLTKKLIVQ